MAKCPNCGEQVPETSTFCPRCGLFVRSEPAQRAASSLLEDPLDQMKLPPLRPRVVTTIGSLQIVGAVLVVLLGFLFASFSATVALPFIVLGVLVGFLGKGLLDGNPWAWTLDTVLNMLGVPLSLALFLLGNPLALPTVFTSAVFAYYLTRENARTFFGKLHNKRP